MHPREKTTTLLGGLRNLAPANLKIQYERGCFIVDDNTSSIPAAVSAAQNTKVSDWVRDLYEKNFRSLKWLRKFFYLVISLPVG
jgi:hypothetical protein